MPEIALAAQLVFANVEREQSPNRKRGLQTLYATRKDERDRLATPEILEIESRLGHDARGGNSLRHLFFRTRPGKFALARFRTLDEPDRFGRSGRYFAHVLIFRPEEFERLGSDPFVAFGATDGPFREGLEETVAAGDRATGEIPPARVAATDRPPCRWESPFAPGAVGWLVMAALRASKLVAEKRCIALCGPHDAVLSALEGFFSWLTPATRRDCTFDTMSTERSAEKSGLWAACLSELPDRRSSLMAIPAGCAPFEPPMTFNPETTLERWVDHVARSDVGESGLDDLCHVQGLEDAIRAADRSRAHLVPSTVQRAYLDANPDEVLSQLLARVRRISGGDPGPWLGRLLEVGLSKVDDPGRRIDLLLVGPDPATIFREAARRQLREPSEPTGVDINVIGRFIPNQRSAEYRLLEAAHHRFRRDWEALSGLIESIIQWGDDPTPLIEWLLRSCGAKVELWLRQGQSGLTYGALIAADPPRIRATRHVVIAILGGRWPEEDEPAEESFEVESERVAGALAPSWIDTARRMIGVFNAEQNGRAWRLTPHTRGLYFGLNIPSADPSATKATSASSNPRSAATYPIRHPLCEILYRVLCRRAEAS